MKVFQILHDARLNGGNGNNLSYSWMLELEENDVIQLEISSNAMYADAKNHVIFTGQLIMSDFYEGIQ